MGRALIVCFCVLTVLAPQAALAQSYQQYSDGLVSVTVKRVLETEQRIAFDVCAQLMRQEKVDRHGMRAEGRKGLARDGSSALGTDRDNCATFARPRDGLGVFASMKA